MLKSVPVVLIFLLLAGAGAARGQEALLVPSWDPVYEDLDRLVEAGLVPDVPVGQRPWSVRQLRRVADRASALLSESELAPARRDHLRRLLARIERRMPSDARIGGEVFVEAWAADSPARTTPYNRVGRIEDTTNPLLAYRHGRPATDGTGVVLEPALAVAPHRRVGIRVRPRLQAVDGGSLDGGFQSLHGRLLLGNLAVVLGRSDLSWGRRAGEGLLLSGNARPLDMLHLSNDLPFGAGPVGPTRLSFFAADLGENQTYPHTKLFGARVAARPSPRLELALSFLNEQGGEGAPEADFWERVADVLLVPDLLIESRDFQFSEKFAAGEIRWWPSASPNLHLFLEGAITDLDFRRVGSILTDDAAWSGGAELSGLGARGAGWARLSAATTGPRFYRHEQFPTGLVVDGAILGSALGPDASSLTAEGGWEDGGGRRWDIAAAWERRSADPWAFSPEERPTFRKLEDGPDEDRLRVRATLALLSGETFIEIETAAERITSFAFHEGDDRTAVLLLVRASRVLRP